ncbi:site-specific tyrosine recombinase XerC [Aeoliella mucimassa]|uniref:Site-specific tyrosine recombinase XerC n=1 Tax=Aeoliella mucimassa TaxID=2527972 RepID=A0A518ASB3_9BACT|nr:site-specific tyrosine recombinase XerC [Aeoliella mucimassa]
MPRKRRVPAYSLRKPAGPIFLNSNGKPWTKDSINSAFCRLKKKTKMDSLCAYDFRHGFATETLKRGVDTTTVLSPLG